MNGAPELWAGAECTIHRVGDRWRDQSRLTGFRDRLDDLDRLATLGTRRMRLPLLWEHLQPDEHALPDFSWPDRALARVRELGMQAIVGLLHHGSGPAHTSLVDARFPELFSGYARRVAERFPDERWWTPINEPLTTARFSCLYGLWYPHHRDDRSFVRALLHQVQATVLAMRAIREVNPDAELLQTDDLGHTRCTPSLIGQAAFDNERRWLAFDLLAGKVDEDHPLWDWLRACGATEHELRQLQEQPCPPQIIGINAYVTSERFLDERLELHPPHLHGGNGRDRYVDIEVVRAHGGFIDGFEARLREAHARYGWPVALTEVHLGCTREEQMRWFHQAWQAAQRARADDIDVRGVTAWAAFGTVDWNSLLTREDGHYEPGLWDVRGGAPRLTALGRLAGGLASHAPGLHPVLRGPGWWQRDLRHVVEPHGAVMASPMSGDPLLILGDGALARAFERLCHMRGLPARRVPGALDGGVAGLVERHAPWAVIDTTAWDGSSRPRRKPRMSMPWLVVVREDADDVPDDPDTLTIRTSQLFGPWHADDFVARGTSLLRAGREWRVRAGQRIRPTYVPDLVQACLDLLIDGEAGTWSLNNGETLPAGLFARRVAVHLGLDARLVRYDEGPREPLLTPRSVPCPQMPPLSDALSRYRQDLCCTPAQESASNWDTSPPLIAPCS